jgi:NLR family CARD domain-containing protein 3
LEWLSLSDNSIRDKGVAALRDALETNATLKDLSFYCNKIGDEGAASFGEVLKVNTSLTRLNLGRANVGNDGASALAEAMKINTKLSSLALYNNRIGEEGASSLLDVLTKCSVTLTGLYLESNGNISGTVYAAIAAFTSANSEGTRLIYATKAELDLSSRRIRSSAKQFAM